MSEELTLKEIAVHYVDKPASRLKFAPHALRVDDLSPDIVKFFLALVWDIWNKEDEGSHRSANFAADGNGSGSYVKNRLGALAGDSIEFFSNSKELAQHLYDQTPGTASPGLLAVLQFRHMNSPTVFVAVLKIRHKDEKFIRLVSQTLTDLDVEKVEYMLQSNLQKGTIIPHPTKHDYDLKLVDRVVRTEEPAIYFSEGFLGCVAKRSDEHQIKKLLPMIVRYAESRHLQDPRIKLPNVIAALQDRDDDITTSTIVDVLTETQALGTEFERDDFIHFVEQEGDIGAIDIPNEQFRGRGKTRKPRQLVYKFTDPTLRGLTISGPSDVMTRVLSVDGDEAVFRVETTIDGYNVTYE